MRKTKRWTWKKHGTTRNEKTGGVIPNLGSLPTGLLALIETWRQRKGVNDEEPPFVPENDYPFFGGATPEDD